jgi:MoaA/NifB/PqqE/SkfB family radical SAM enzyme
LKATYADADKNQFIERIFMSEHLEVKISKMPPRLPLEGRIDLTYRCNNDCRHCWLRIPPAAQEKQEELSLDEIMKLVDDARKMGCRRWSISGGEPMIRPDFADIIDYIIGKSVSYSLNTNGTLITPKIAKLLKAKGNKMIALYGATAEIHDHITRNPGSFDATMRGIAYLKEAGAGFVVQIIPMRDNYHQLDDMTRLAETLSPYQRMGASWLYLSACGDQVVNKEIIRQRLSPKEVIKIDNPNIFAEENSKEENEDVDNHSYCHQKGDDRLFASCISKRRDFHVDPYGQMSFCSFIKEPELRYDLRTGSFRECWDEFIPFLADNIRGGHEYLENCGSCELKKDCWWCPVYGYLEHRRFSAKVEYLCDLAQEMNMFKEERKKDHRRYYEIAGITIQLELELPLADNTFRPKFKQFQVDGPGEDNIIIHHYFSIPNLEEQNLGKEIYKRVPWAIYKKSDSWIYLGISPDGDDHFHRIAIFNEDHTKGDIYSPDEKSYLKGGLSALTFFPSDQVLLARVLADREACYMHSSGVNLDGDGFIFLGHSGAGKSTMATMLKEKNAEILCDDRVIVRRWKDGFRIHGNWSHGDVPIVSPNSAPLKAVMFLEQARDNRLVPIESKKEIIGKLLSCIVKPLETSDWWEKIFDLAENISNEVPCYSLQFDKSGRVVDLLKSL